MSGKEKLPVMTATCCRDWPVVPGYSIRKCGLCGKPGHNRVTCKEVT